MFNIYYSTTRWYFNCNLQQPLIGRVATFCNNREVTLSNDKLYPAGIFLTDHIQEPFESYNPYANSRVVIVADGVYETDVFEDGTYAVGDFLYCNEKGMITNNKKFQGNISLGIVNDVNDEQGTIGFVFSRLAGVVQKEKEIITIKTPEKIVTKSRYDILKEKVS